MSLLGGRAGTVLSGTPAIPLILSLSGDPGSITLVTHATLAIRQGGSDRGLWSLPGSSWNLASALTCCVIWSSCPVSLRLSVPTHKRKMGMLVCPSQSWCEDKRGGSWEHSVEVIYHYYLYPQRMPEWWRQGSCPDRPESLRGCTGSRWGGRWVKRVPGGKEEEQKHGDLCVYNLGKGSSCKWLEHEGWVDDSRKPFKKYTYALNEV